ncbi:MAG: hypothetical protein U9Q15_00985 [Patescibacteria group bacterium]|nr:hypothetical protein [Patescibacteria group bacterium]
MKKLVLTTLLAGLFIGCGSGGSSSENVESSTGNTPNKTLNRTVTDLQMPPSVPSI